MAIKIVSQMLSILAIALLLVACGGSNDPILKEINEGLDAEIDDFDLNISDINPGETLDIRWESSGAIIFDAKVYLSEDSRISAQDPIIVDEECSTSSNDHCSATSRVTFECRYRSDNTFDCEEDDKLLKQNDLTEFLDEIPKDAFVILELCNDGDCESQAEELTFR